MRRLTCLLALLAAAVPTAASAGERFVTMPGARYEPSRVLAVPGDNVTWTNQDFAQHNVVSGTFPSSGTMSSGDTHTVTFSMPGIFEFQCTFHPATMRGTVVVRHVHLSGPAFPVLYGRTARLTGLAQPGAALQIVRVADGAAVATSTAGGDGRFVADVPSARPGAYRAVDAGANASDPAQVAVRARVSLSARRSGRVSLLTVTGAPSQAGASYVLERARGFSWVRIGGGRLGPASKATVRYRPSATVRVRARLTRAVRGYSAATSSVVTVRR